MMVVSGKTLRDCVSCKQKELLSLQEKLFLVEKQLADKLQLFSIGYLGGIFSKMNAVSLSLQEKQLAVFCASDRTQAFKQ